MPNLARPVRRCALALLLPLAVVTACDRESAGGANVAVAVPATDAGSPADSADAAKNPQPAAAPAEASGPTTSLPANELGRIMVLEYHRLGDNEGEFIRSAANFKKDLETLYERGYRPVTMRQVLDRDLDLPAGTTPVVFTIDDSSRGQFYYREDGSIDPNTMVGMWEQFQKTHPGWNNGAVWCILPAADHPSNFFGTKPAKEMPRQQREDEIRRKVGYLVENGHEICNHTLYHARLDRATGDTQVQDWIGIGEDSIRAYLPPDYDIVTFALPLGQWPKNRALAGKGSYRNGKTYENRAVLEVSGGPNVSPFDREFDAYSVDRFIVAPNHLERQLDAYDKDPSKRYVSDGDPRVVTVPEPMADRLDRSRLDGRTARVLPAPAEGVSR